MQKRGALLHHLLINTDLSARMDAQLIENLEMVGLTRTESKVYLFLLQKGSGPQSEITKSTQLHRRTVYDILARLAEKGVVSSITKNNRMYYEAVNPERLRECFRKKKTPSPLLFPNLSRCSKPAAQRRR